MQEPEKRPYKHACIGDIYNKLKVVAYSETLPDGKRTVFVECQCGSPRKRVRVPHLVDGTTKSCGCHRDENFANNRANSRIRAATPQTDTPA